MRLRQREYSAGRVIPTPYDPDSGSADLVRLGRSRKSHTVITPRRALVAGIEMAQGAPFLHELISRIGALPT